MKVRATALPEVLLIEPELHTDERGNLFESWQDKRHAGAGLPRRFVQDNVSRSRRGVLRGLHLQEPHAQAKLVTALSGVVYDVAVDLRVDSPRFGRWVGVRLDAAAGQQLFVPAGFAHGFCALRDDTVVGYKCSERYHPEAQLAIAWNDPELAIAWPIAQPLLSARDAAAPPLSAVPRDRLPRLQRAPAGLARDHSP